MRGNDDDNDEIDRLSVSSFLLSPFFLRSSFFDVVIRILRSHLGYRRDNC